MLNIIFPITLPFLAALVATVFISMPPQTEDSYGASCTSCYTTEEKQDSYSTLSNILQTKCSDELVRQVVLDMMAVCADITDALRVNLVTVEGSANVFGDSQLSVDVSDEKVSSNEHNIGRYTMASTIIAFRRFLIQRLVVIAKPCKFPSR